jgi:carbon storage regulator CsrA
MLVLSRKLDEKIVIGDNIVIKVVKIRGGVVRLGIEAPTQVTIMRSELNQADTRIEKVKSHASNVGPAVVDKVSTICRPTLAS